MKKCTNPSRVATDSGSQSSAIESSSPASWPRMRSTENPPTTGRRPAGCMCETTRRSFRLQSSDLDPLPAEPRSLALSSSNGSVTQGLQIPTVVRIALSRNTGLLERSELLPTTAYDCPPMPALVGTKSAPGRPRRGSYLLSPVKFHRGPLPRSGRPESAPHRAEPTHLKTGQRRAYISVSLAPAPWPSAPRRARRPGSAGRSEIVHPPAGGGPSGRGPGVVSRGGGAIVQCRW